MRLEPLQNDRFSARFEVTELGRWHYTFIAWVDHFATWQRGLQRTLEAAQDIDVVRLIGAELLSAVGHAYRGLGAYTEAERMFAAALASRRGVANGADPGSNSNCLWMSA